MKQFIAKLDSLKDDLKATVEQSAHLEQEKICGIFIDHSGNLTTLDTQSSIENCAMVFSAYSIQNSDGKWQAGWSNRMDRFDIEKWLNK